MTSKSILERPGHDGDGSQVRYFIDYQYMAESDVRPRRHGEVIGIRASDSRGVVVLPNVGDYVSIDTGGAGASGFSGRVRSRYFRYFKVRRGFSCYVNIVVEEVDDSFDKLLNEGSGR